MAATHDPYSPERIALNEQYTATTYNVIWSTISTYAVNSAAAIGSARPVLGAAAEAAIAYIATYEAGDRAVRGLPPEERTGNVQVHVDQETVLFYALMIAAKVTRATNPDAITKHVMIHASEWLTAITGKPLPDWVVYLRDNCERHQAAYAASADFPETAGNA